MLTWRRDNKDNKEAENPVAPAPVPNMPKSDPDPLVPPRPEAAPPPMDIQHPRSRLGDILVEEGAITPGQLREALAKQGREGGFLGQTLVDLKFIHREMLISFLVKQCKIPHISLLDFRLNEDLLEYVPAEVCCEYNLLPIDKLGRILTIAMVDPLDIEALEAVRAAAPDLKIKPILCDWYHYETIARRVFNKDKPLANEATADSFGLPARPKPDAAPKAVPAPAPSAAGADTPARPAEPVGPSLEDLRTILREDVHEAIQAAVANLAEAEPREYAGPSAEALAVAISETLRGAMRDMAGALKESISAQGTPPQSPEQLGQIIRDSIRDAMKEAITTLVKSGLESRKTETGPTPQQLAEIMRDSVREAVKEAVAAVSGTLETGSAPDKAVAWQAQQALANQEARLKQLADAAIQAAKAAEAAAAEKQHQHSRIVDERRRRHASVTPLNKAEFDALEAIDGPGLRTRADERVHAALASELPLAGYTFDGYFVGKGNSFTVALGKAVSEKPGGEYNPFFLYGDVGIGKTHLINAIGNQILSKSPTQRVGYVSSSRFASHLIDAIQEHAVEAFRENYCHWDVLILDDIQFMGGRVEAQEEFFHIFNALHQEGRQIIIAGDKPPDQLGQLEKRLVSRFAGGIVASLRPPEWETRMAILRHQIKGSQVKVPEEVLSLIATRVPNDVRKMSGSVRKVVAFAGLVGQEVTCDLTVEILSHLGMHEVA